MNDDMVSTLWNDSNGDNHSGRKEKILRAVTVWFTGGTPLVGRKGLLEWLFTGRMEKATKPRLKTELELKQFVPALFEMNHDDDSTFADERDRTPLHRCLSRMGKGRTNYNSNGADCKLVSVLCDLGASIIALDCDGRSPLGMAWDNGRMDVVEVLIRSVSKNVADRNNLGQTALHILIDKYDHLNGDYRKYQVLVMELLDKGADLNQRDANGVTPVHLAAKNLDIGLLQKFKEKGANLICRTKCGDDLFTIIFKNMIMTHGDESKMFKLFNYLISLPDFCLDGESSHVITALQYVARSESIGIMKRLIRDGVHLHAVAGDNTNVLHSAAMSTNFGAMLYLVELSVDYRRRDNAYGFSMIHMAVLSGDPRICEWLVKQKGFDVDDLGKWQLTPLHLASMIGNAEVVKKLIELGADVHRTHDIFRYSALHLASMTGRFTVATLRYIRANGREEIKEYQWSVVDHCFNYHGLFDSSANYEATIVAILEAGAEVNARDNHGCTPLHYATPHSAHDDRIITVLLEAGAHVDLQDNKCSTPLENSSVSNNHHRLRNLLTFGANITEIGHLVDEIYQTGTVFDAAPRMIVEHLLKLKVAGLHIDESCKCFFDNCGSFYLEKQSDLSAELTKMKERMLTDEVSLYDVLHMSFKRRSTFANRLPRDIETEFPNYSVVSKGRCNEAVYRMALFEPAVEAFERITGMHWPDICIDIIMSFMSNVSLRVLIDAASVTE